jgi:hypothetical protein
MNLLVGLLLIAVFGAFAALMFLEKLSALLALPMMAFVFLLLTATADLFQPRDVTVTLFQTETDTYGRRQTLEDTNVRQPSRFAGWCRMRHAQLAALHTRAQLFAQAQSEMADAIASCAESPGDCRARLPAAVRRIHELESSLVQVTTRAFADEERWPRLFARPPHHRGQFAEFRDAFDALSITAQYRPVVAVLEARDWPATEDEIRAIVAAGRRAADDALVRHPAPPDITSRGFRLACAGSYLLQHLLMMLKAGSLSLAGVIIATLFGGMFAVYVRNLKVAERLVYWTAEFAGERPRIICLAIFLVTGMIFTSVGGLGTVIMLGTIILPILRSVGMGALLSSGVFLMGIAMGGTLQPVSRRLWLDFYGIPPAQLDGILWTMVALYFIGGVTWIVWGTRGSALSNFLADPADDPPPPKPALSRRLMAAPLIPVGLVYFGGIEEITAFSVALVYMYLCVRSQPGATRVFTRSLIEGAQLVVPPVLLMIGIGILLTSLRSAPVQGYLVPLLRHVVPDSRWGYIALFALAAPLALYRGPLNVWGMGLAVSATLLATSSLAPAAILGAILAAGALQSVCDPTNTANVWVAGFQGVTVNQILRATLLVVWSIAIAGVVIFGFWFVP